MLKINKVPYSQYKFTPEAKNEMLRIRLLGDKVDDFSYQIKDEKCVAVCSKRRSYVDYIRFAEKLETLFSKEMRFRFILLGD